MKAADEDENVVKFKKMRNNCPRSSLTSLGDASAGGHVNCNFWSVSRASSTGVGRGRVPTLD